MSLANQPLTIEVSDRPAGARVLTLTGPFTLQTLFDFQSEVRRDADRPIILEMSGVPYMDSAGLGSVISTYASCQRTSRSFAVVGICDRIRTLFEVTRVNGLLPVFASVEEAEAQQMN